MYVCMFEKVPPLLLFLAQRSLGGRGKLIHQLCNYVNVTSTQYPANIYLHLNLKL